MGCCCGKQSDHQQLPRGESKKGRRGGEGEGGGGGRGGEGEGGGRSYSQLDNVQYHAECVHLPLKNEYEPQPADLAGQQEQGPEPVRMLSLPAIAPQVEREFEPSGKFHHLPESYSKPQITPASENAAFDLAAGEVKQIFDTQVVAPRRRIDSCLKEFKKSLNEGPDAPLTSCFDSWNNKVFEGEWDVPAGEGEFLIQLSKVSGSDEEVVKAISANKEEEELTPEVNAVQSHMNTLLEACHELLNNTVRTQQQISEKNLQLSLTENRNMRTEAILRELRGLPAEVDRFTKEVLDLLNDIKGAVVLYGRKKPKTGVLMRLD